jgi:hypothetical protein
LHQCGSMLGVQWLYRHILISVPDDGPVRLKHVEGNKYSTVKYCLIINHFVAATANLTKYAWGKQQDARVHGPASLGGERCNPVTACPQPVSGFRSLPVRLFGLEGRGVGIRVPIEARFFFSPRHPGRFWGHPDSCPMYPGLFPWV